MRKANCWVICWMGLWLGVSCAHKGEQSEPKLSFGTQVQWLGGRVNDGFHEAKKLKKPVLVFWGASWCPACVEVKNTVFSHPRIQEVLDPFVLIYIDGDMDHAQAWGEILDLTAYPSMVVFNDQREEILRIQENIRFTEFELLMRHVRSHMQPISTLLERVENGPVLNESEWQSLAYFSWGFAQNRDYSADEWMRRRLLAFQRIPAELKGSRALLGSKMLEDCSQRKAGVCLDVAKEYSNIWNAMNQDASTRLATRQTLLFASSDIIRWIFSQPQHAQSESRKWIEAVQSLNQENPGEESITLFTDWIHLQWTPASKVDLTKLRSSIQDLDSKLKTNPRRHVWLSAAYQLLRKVEDWDFAERLLKKELLTTDHSFYVFHMLSQVYEQRKDQTSALDAIQKARSNAPHGATRIQWHVREMKWIRMMDEGSFQKQKYRLIQELYNTVFSYPSSFYGRSYRSLSELEDWIEAKDMDATLKKGLGGFKLRCQRLTPFARQRCVEHFDRLLLKSAS